ncbi:hypothetical protein JCM17844_00950 [Iodidimonas gelatinilytica]|uniref:Sulfotransferase family protein n=1 Tax=Iodidimonas gelatinilytica TaxID=1236966 RepID=A0A5A7MNB9_9PROT|nr:sulfotransferase family 2 domain-containing protein [Iodidimonas gelatinilytica]GEQ96458.1 hypothetical protein JCM17844_00950 [Iodidimonas gelatinilytica]
MTKPYIWLHIRKAGGTSLRDALGSSYKQVDRFGATTPFIALPQDYWNDNLNNYRVPLGDYEFKRLLFAKKFLYPEPEFSNRFKFAIVRNPYGRAVSSWRYLTRNWTFTWPRQVISHYRFDHFLERLPEFWEKIGKERHVATHTAPIWPDITDENGALLLDFVGRIENFEEDYLKICEHIGIPQKDLPKKNSQGGADYRKYYNKKSRKLVEKYYWDDINELGYDY